MENCKSISDDKNLEIDVVKVRNVTSILDLLINFFMFLSTLFIGADIFGVNVGVNLRLDQVFLTLTALLLFSTSKYKIKKVKYLLPFLILTFISTIFSYNLTRSLMFYASIIYNTFFVLFVYYNYIYFYGIQKFLNLFRKTLYVSFYVFALQYILKIGFDYDISFMPSYGYYLGVVRFKLWFYEPSYMATYIIFWFSLSLYMFLIGKENSYIKDLVFSTIMLIFSTSTSGYIGMAISLFIIYMLWLLKGFSINKLSFLFLILLLFLVFRFGMENVYNLFFKRLFNQSLDSASGGRISNWSRDYNVFMNNFLFGVGPGCYGLYTTGNTLDCPSNVTLDLFSTLGIFPSIFFILIHISLLIKCYKVYKFNPKQNKLFLGLILSFIIFILILQFNQGYLRLYHWMFLGIMLGFVERYKKINYINIKTISYKSTYVDYNKI